MTPQAQLWFSKLLLAFSESTLATFLRMCQAGDSAGTFNPVMRLAGIETMIDRLISGGDLVEVAMRYAVQANTLAEANGVRMDVYLWLQEFDHTPRADFIAAMTALTMGELERRRDPLRN